MRKRILLALLLTALAALRASAQDTPVAAPPIATNSPLLAEERWRESAYGISFLQPRGAEKLENTADGSLVRFTLADGTTISVAIRQNLEAELDLATLKQQTMVEVSYRSRQALVIDESVVRPAGRPGTLTYFDIERDRNVFDKGAGDHWALGQAMMKIDPHTVAVFQLRTSVPAFPEHRKTFEALLDSVEMARPDELDRVRKAWISAGQRWYEGVDRAALLATLINDQWYRVLEGDQDVGYARVRHALGETLNLPGLRVEVQSRIVSGADAFDTESFFFISDDRTTEVWSVRTAQRVVSKTTGLPGPGAARAPELYEETGLRSGDSISVKRTLPGKVDDLAWKMPPEGYLSQAELHLLPPLFPRDEQRDLAFYAYNSGTGELALRKFSIFPREDGSFVVRERPAPAQGEQNATYNAAGQLQRREMSDGRVYVPATPEEMKRIWNIR